MADIPVERLATKLKMPVDELLTKLDKAGLQKAEGDTVTEAESRSFIAFLMNKDGKADAKPKKLSLKRKRSSEELVTDAAGGGTRKVKVIRRKERVVQKKTSLLNELNAPVVEESVVEPEIEESIINLEEQSVVVDAVQEVKNTTETEDATNNISPDVESSQQQDNSEEKEAEAKKAAKVAKPKKAPELKGSEGDDESGDGKSVTKHRKKVHQGDNAHWNAKKALEAFASESDDASDVDSDVTIAVKPQKKIVKKVEVVREIKPEHGFKMPQKPIIHEVAVPAEITVGELAQRMAMKSGKLIKTLMQMGHMATINQVLDQDTAILAVEELGHKPRVVRENAFEEDLKAKHEQQLGAAPQVTRAPVVTIMGHVDHGKTSLLDYIRRTKVTAKEAGGITQHIGAYSVNTGHGKITFLDTPGHAAFSSMRARGANITDVVVLVVSADDGVMPQTVEAIQHAKAAGVPIVVAVNKIDKPEADPEKIKTELSHHEIISEAWGGEHQFIHVSAKTGEGIDALLDAILVQTEILELKAPVDVPAKGVVVEARLDKGRGVVATILVQQGQLKKGDIVLAGSEYGRVRAMVDAAGKVVERAGPSDPVEILGLSAAPHAGDDVMVVESERSAREISLYRQSVIRRAKQEKQRRDNLESLFSKAGDTEVSILNIILKADVQGSVEAIISSLEKISTDEVKVKAIGSGVGGINESDVTLAMASNAIIIGFNVRADQGARKLIESENIKVIYDSIIYNVIDDVKQILSGMLSPEIREEILGLAEVRDVFRSSKIGAIAGCMVVEGTLKRNNPIRVLRDNVVIYEGELESLRRFKDDVNEVKQGVECGIGVKNYNDVKVGDQIEVFKKVEHIRTLD